MGVDIGDGARADSGARNAFLCDFLHLATQQKRNNTEKVKPKVSAITPPTSRSSKVGALGLTACRTKSFGCKASRWDDRVDDAGCGAM
jgi:hypothetical protein